MNSPTRRLTPEQAMQRAAALCARSEQAPSDVREKLKKWGLSSGEVTQVLRQLTDQGFMDERRYARAFVKDKFAFNGWGRVKISHQLRLKGINAAAIDEAMKCKETGEEKTILFGLTGTGYFDMVAYEKYHDGLMDDYIPTDEDLERGFAGIPKVDL